MPNNYKWIGGTGAQSWATGANWLKDDGTTGTVPGTGDSAYILSGASDINAGLAQSAVTLAFLSFGGSFSGTVGTTGNTADALAIGATNWNCDCPSPRIKLDFGSVAYTGVVQQAGSADTSTDPHALQVRGGTAGSKLYVVGNETDVGVATARPGLTATLAEFDVSAGNLTLDPGVTCPAGNQSGGNLFVNCAMSGSLVQTGGNLTTGGTGLIATLRVGSQATLNHRPASGSAITTLTVDDGATADFSTDPRPVLIANPINAYKDSTINAFSPTQLQITIGPAPIQVRCQQCGPEDVTLNFGRQVLLTIDAG